MESKATSNLEVEVETKKLKLAEESPSPDSGVNSTNNGNGSTKETQGVEAKVFVDFAGFELKRILSNSADNKRVIVEAKVTHSDSVESAIVVLDKKPFTEEVLGDFYSLKSTLAHTFQNDIYGSYYCHPTVAALGSLNIFIMFPFHTFYTLSALF